MCCDRNVRALSDFDYEFYFVEREYGRRALSAPTIVSVDLDPISAVPDLIADDTSQAIDTVSLFSALRYTPFRCIAFCAVAAGGDKCFGHHQHAWSRDNSLLHCLLESDVSVFGAFSSQVADSRETCLQSVAQMIRRARNTQGQRLLCHLIVPP